MHFHPSKTFRFALLNCFKNQRSFGWIRESTSITGSAPAPPSHTGAQLMVQRACLFPPAPSSHCRRSCLFLASWNRRPCLRHNQVGMFVSSQRFRRKTRARRCLRAFELHSCRIHIDTIGRIPKGPERPKKKPHRTTQKSKPLGPIVTDKVSFFFRLSNQWLP